MIQNRFLQALLILLVTAFQPPVGHATRQGIPLIQGDQSSFDGSSVSVAIIDDAFDISHAALGGSAKKDSCEADFLNRQAPIAGGYNYRPDKAEGKKLFAAGLTNSTLAAAAPCPELRRNSDGSGKPVEGYGSHGTPVAGIVAGLQTKEAVDYAGGVAPGTKLYLLKTARNGQGASIHKTALAFADLVRQISGQSWQEYRGNPNMRPMLVLDKYSPPIKIVLMAGSRKELGDHLQHCDQYLDQQARAKPADKKLQAMNDIRLSVNRLVEMDITVINSAANNRKSALPFPACLEDTIAVSAVVDDGSNQIDHSSNFGPLTDLLAPGDFATAPDGYWYHSNNPTKKFDPYPNDGQPAGYVNFANTSAAAPYVAGAAAVVQQAATKKLGRFLTPKELKQVLQDTGKPIKKGNLTKKLIQVQSAISQL